MDDPLPSKREFLTRSGALLAALAVAGAAEAQAPAPTKIVMPLDYPGHGPIPWFTRVFHLYTGPDGHSVAVQLPTNTPEGVQAAQYLRRTAERVTIGGTAEGAGFRPHVANQPTLLIPIFGVMLIELHDGTRHELRHGDLAIAEDCTGDGHISRAGKGGSFMVAIQLPKLGCPAAGGSDMTRFLKD